MQAVLARLRRLFRQPFDPDRPGPLPEGWEPVPAAEAGRLEAALSRSLPRGHCLAAGGWRAVGREVAGDDVLFALRDGGFALVHMTWSRERDPDRPDTSVFDRFGEFADWARAEAAANQTALEGIDKPASPAKEGDIDGTGNADPWAVAPDSGPDREPAGNARPSDASVPAICSHCRANWTMGDADPDCPVCDGFALTRPCPLCAGTCGAVWRRAVLDSNDLGEAVWIGTCAADGA